LPGAVLAFFIECACPPDRRSAIVGAGDELKTVEDFLASYPLTHIVCGACDTYYRLIGYIDESGVERSIDPLVRPRAPAARRGWRLRRGISARY
jgi:hypothetical protein